MKKSRLILSIFLYFCFLLPAHALSHDEFIEKVRQNDIKAVQAAIVSGQNINAYSPKSQPALFEAMKIPAYPQIIDLLIAASADVNIKDSNGRSPLFYAGLIAATTENASKVHILRSLLSAGADVNVRDKENKTPLIFMGVAFQGRNPQIEKDILNLLLDSGANVNAVDDEKTSPLISWIDADISCLQELMKAGADINAQNVYGITPLFAATISPNINDENIVFLINSKADVNAKLEDARTPVFFAAMQGRSRVVCSLLEAGAEANISIEGVTPLHLATGAGMKFNVFGIQVPLNKNFYSNALKFFPKADFLATTEALIKAGAQINMYTQKNPFTVFSFLDRSFNSKTPVDFASLIGNNEVEEYLKTMAKKPIEEESK